MRGRIPSIASNANVRQFLPVKVAARVIKTEIIAIHMDRHVSMVPAILIRVCPFAIFVDTYTLYKTGAQQEKGGFGSLESLIWLHSTLLQLLLLFIQ